MFISYESGETYESEEDGKRYRQYELTDSEFGTVLEIIDIRFSFYNFENAVIQEYSKRNLNVAANLMRAFIWYAKKYPGLSIQYLIEINKKYNPLFAPYEKDIDKYLLLI
jgi:hypothetical protein